MKLNLSSAFALSLLSLLFTFSSIYGAVLVWDGGGANTYVYTSANWNPNGLPKSGNTGVVPAGFTTTAVWGDGLDGMKIDYNGDSSFRWSGNAYPNGGFALNFNDTSTLIMPNRLYLAAGTGGASLTFNQQASGFIGDYLNFGNSSGSPSAASLTLNDESTFTYTTALYALDDGPNLTHTVTLNDKAKFIGLSSTFYYSPGTKLVMNFVQENRGFTPSWTLPSYANFNQSFIQYQINGINTTLSDERFLQSTIGGKKILFLATIPEPGSLALILLGGVIMIFRRRKFRKTLA